MMVFQMIPLKHSIIKNVRYNLLGYYTKSRYLFRSTSIYTLSTEQVRHICCKNFSNPHKRSIEHLISHGHDLVSEASTMELDKKEIEKVRSHLSSVLYQLYIRKDVNLIPFFEKINQSNVLLRESMYTIMMRHYADLNDITMVKKYFKLLKENRSVPAHSRSYVPLIEILLRLDNIEESGQYMNEMVTSMRPRFDENSFYDIINICTEIRTQDNQDSIEQFIDDVFALFEKLGSNELDKQLVVAICNWFNRDLKRRWKIQKISLGKNGVCSCCKRHLKKATITPDRFIRLKQNMLALIKAAVINKESSTVNSDFSKSGKSFRIKDEVLSRSKSPEFQGVYAVTPPDQKSNTSIDIANSEESLPTSLQKFKDYLSKHGKFDIVIDGSNMGYLKGRYNPAFAKNVADVFIKQRKRILILCAGRLRGELLTSQMSTSGSTRQLKQLLVYLNRYCDLYFVGSNRIDDYYILYTLVHHNFEIKLVSRDMSGDHLFHLDTENMTDFKIWQRSNQYIIYSVTNNGKPVFNTQTDFHISMQKHGDGWHIPIGNQKWYCISKDL